VTVLSQYASSRRARPRRVRAIGVGAIVVVVAAGAAAQFLDYGLHLDIAALDSNDDGGAFGIVGDLALASTAVAAWRMQRSLRDWGPLCAALAPVLTFLAIDKTLRLHDHISAWRLYYAPLLLLAFIALLKVADRLPAPTARLIHVGLVLLVVAFGLHLTGHALLDRLGYPEDSWADQIKGVVKHGAEVAGWLSVSLGLTLGRPVRQP
jgi:hypothetical protein